LSAATIFDPIKPAPPVTSNILRPAPDIPGQLCPTPARQATWVIQHSEDAGTPDFTPRRGAVTDRLGV
jgi:hypothetical protein